jgi:hypothetical protein
VARLAEQTSIPVPESPKTPAPCAWCGATPTQLYEVRPVMRGKAANGAKIVRKAPLMMPACAAHRAAFDAQRPADS